MKKNIVIAIMTFIVICMGIFVYIDTRNDFNENRSISNNNLNENKEVVIEKEESKKEEVKEETKTETKVEVKTETKVEEKAKEEVKSEEKVEVKEEPKEELVATYKPTNEDLSYLEVEVKEEPVKYFLSESKLLDDANESDVRFRDKAKQLFVDIIDFIFYDKEIKGVKFNELTNEAKLKIIEIALNVDKKIDSKFPNYKESVKESISNAKGKLAIKYLEVSSKVCDSLGEYKCDLAKKSFKSLRDSFSFTYQLVKELAKSGSQKAKEMYEKFRK